MQLRLLRSACYVVLLTLLAISVTVDVHAQTTSVSNLNYASSGVVGRDITVSFDVTYSKGNNGVYVNSWIYDKDALAFASGAASVSSGYTCEQETGQYANTAFCGMNQAPSSGSFTVTFSLSLQSVKTYNFWAGAGIEDASYNVISDSMTNQDFSITVVNKFTLTVSVPDQVSVTLDGVPQGVGSTSSQLSPGMHVISVPDIVQLDSTSRLKFNSWSDGSTQTTKTFDLESDTYYTPTYVTQYKLTLVTSQGVAIGEDWYDEGTTAVFSVPSSVPMNGFLGTLGGKYDFQGWYEGKTLVSSSSNSSLKMNSQHTLTAIWTPNYIAPITILGIAVIAVVGLTYYLIQKKAAKPKRRRTRRKMLEQDTEEPGVPGEAKATEIQEIEPAESIAEPEKTTMFCTECGAVISRDSKFCKECGTPITPR